MSSPQHAPSRRSSVRGRNVAVAALVLGIPLLELWLLFVVAHAIGGWATVGLVLLGTLLGAWLLRRRGSRSWRGIRAAVARGEVPIDEATDAVLGLAGSLLLIFPGFLTDVLGLVALLPLTRPVARRAVRGFVGRRVDLSAAGLMRSRMNLDGRTVEGEVVPDSGSSAWQPGAGAQRQVTGEVVSGEVID